MTLSVVVCTHDRSDDLSRCLAALAQLRTPVEIVVVDSASARPIPPRADVRVVRLEEPGLSKARNAGLAATTGELVAFVDDDAMVEPDWAERIVAAFSDGGVMCVGGSCIPAFATEPPRWLTPRLLQYVGITRFRGRHEVHARRDYPFGANVCFRREALVDGFPETLGRTGNALLSGEEVAVIDGILERGGRVLVDDGAVVRHTVSAERCRSSYFWRRLWWQGVTRARAEASPRLTARLVVALPIRLCLYLATRDRVHLYRLAETTGYLRELVA